MSKLKEMMAGSSAVHERKLEVRTYPLDDGNLVVEGRLRDERLTGIHHWSGQWADPGVVHHMAVRLLIGGWPIRILDAEAEMPGVPQEMCRETLDSVKNVVGITIVSGYSDEVRRRMGGVAGCTHLTHLVVVMGPAALHGFWTHASRKPRPLPKSLDDIPGLSHLVDSCRLWAKDGPFLKRIREEMESRK